MGKPAGKERGKRTTAIWKNRGVELILVIVGFSIMAYGGLIYRVTDAIPQTVRETLTVNYHSPYTIVTSKLGHKYTILTPPSPFSLPRPSRLRAVSEQTTRLPSAP